MTCGRSHRVRARSSIAGFTLIELLVVVAIISVLMAITLAALHRTRTITCRVTCGRQLQQIVLAWDGYLNDHNQQFLQGSTPDTISGAGRARLAAPSSAC
jgi:prepilin-type N-terminal cleavage/methylation domain-containing protein